MAFHIHTIAFGKTYKPGKCKVPLDLKTAELGEISFNDCWAQKIEDKFSGRIPLFLKESKSRPRRWLASTSRMSSILVKLKQKEDLLTIKYSVCKTKLIFGQRIELHFMAGKVLHYTVYLIMI
jgi:hypothetical protein